METDSLVKRYRSAVTDTILVERRKSLARWATRGIIRETPFAEQSRLTPLGSLRQNISAKFKRQDPATLVN